MSSVWGETIKMSIFGESHGNGIGVVLDGLPAGEALDMGEILYHMSRRAPGNDKTSTSRKESDCPQILSGMYKNSTTGAPLCAIILNNDTHSGDYAQLNRIPRPGHADYTGFMRYGGHNDYRGGGHFSGRLTAPMVFAGAVCRQILARRGISLGAHIYMIGNVYDTPLDPVETDETLLKDMVQKPFPLQDTSKEEAIRSVIEKARIDGDSVGGIVECAATGIPAGVGNPIFGGIENKLSSIIFGIPAVKGIEFGEGFHASQLRGSENNDAYCFDNGVVKTVTNRHGGILGGISSGMPLLFRTAFKPTPSIFKTQDSIDLQSGNNTTLQVKGRHDPCIVIRAVPVVEALTAVCLLDLCLGADSYEFG